MNRKLITQSAFAMLLAITGLATAVQAQSPKLKCSTDNPANVITPKRTETRLGTLKFVDGFPTEATAEIVWNHMDFSRAVEAMIMTSLNSTVHPHPPTNWVSDSAGVIPMTTCLAPAQTISTQSRHTIARR